MSPLALLLALVLTPPVDLGSGSAPAIVQTDAGALVAWRDNGLKVALAGGATATLLDHDPAAHALATIGAESLAVWADGAKLTAVRLDGRGVPIGEPFTIANTTTAQVAAVADGPRYVVAWPGLFGDIWALILDRNGGIFLPPMPVTTQSTDTPTSLHVASNGDTFLLAWTAGRRVFAHLVDINGVPRSFLPVQVTGVGGPSDVASNGRDFLVVWQRTPNGVGLGARAVLADGEVGDELLLTTGTDGEPRIAWDGSAYAVALGSIVQAGPHTVPLLMVERFGANGFPIESTSTVPPAGHAIAARAGRIALSWEQGGRVVVAFADAAPLPSRRRALR
jgi:hypothetical protein